LFAIELITDNIITDFHVYKNLWKEIKISQFIFEFILQFIFLLISNWFLFFFYTRVDWLDVVIDIVLIGYFFFFLFHYNDNLLYLVILSLILNGFLLIILKIHQKMESKFKIFLGRKRNKHIFFKISEFFIVAGHALFIISIFNLSFLLRDKFPVVNFIFSRGFGNIGRNTKEGLCALSISIVIFFVLQSIVGILFSSLYIYKPYLVENNDNSN